jgi:ABC-type dipeptide/oligopeptide/nickel transport system permease component
MLVSGNPGKANTLSMLEVIRSDYTLLRRARVCLRSRILFRHALPNAFLRGYRHRKRYGHDAAGAVVIEMIFAIPGVGWYLVSGIGNRDYAIVQSLWIFLAIAFALTMPMVDIVYAIVDPRTKARFTSKKEKHYA